MLPCPVKLLHTLGLLMKFIQFLWFRCMLTVGPWWINLSFLLILHIAPARCFCVDVNFMLGCQEAICVWMPTTWPGPTDGWCAAHGDCDLEHAPGLSSYPGRNVAPITTSGVIRSVTWHLKKCLNLWAPGLCPDIMWWNKHLGESHRRLNRSWRTSFCAS